MSAKWLELLKQIAPRVTRVAVAAIQSVAQTFGVDVTPIGVRDAGEIKRAIREFARGSNDGLIVPASALTNLHRSLIIKVAAEHRLPAVYSASTFVTDGGLISYGPDRIDMYRRAAGYVDRILKGEKPYASADANEVSAPHQPQDLQITWPYGAASSARQRR